MSNECHINADSGDDWFFKVRDDAGQVAYLAGEVFETYGTDSRAAADYATAYVDKGGDHYVADFPAWISAGVYQIQACKRAGGTPADSDKVRKEGPLRWDGGAEITDAEQALEVDTIAEMAAGAPPASPTIVQILNYLYRLIRNKKVSDKGPPAKLTVYKNDGSTPMFEASLSDNGTIFTKDKFEAP